MEDIKLEYSKDWRNPADFPTIEADEAKVRADMQLLYSEIQQFLNGKLIPIMHLLETPGVDKLPVEDTVTPSKDRIPTSYAVARLFASYGNLPAGGAAGQFLVKSSDDYGDAAWRTFRIPGRLSDLIAVNADGTPINAQALMTAVEESVYHREAEVLSEGIVRNGLELDISHASEYEAVWLCFDCDGNPSPSPAALYFGKWNGGWVTDVDGNRTVDETGMFLLSRFALDSVRHTSVSADLSMLPIKDGTLLHYQQWTRLSGGETVCGGLLIHPISAGEVPDHTKITMFSEAVIPDTGETGTQIRYKVYGIRRGRTTEVT